MRWLFASGGQSIGAAASASDLPMTSQGWFPLGLTGLISVLSKGTLKSFLQHHSLKASIICCSYASKSSFPVFISIHDYWKKIITLTIWTFVGKVMSLLFNTLSRFIIAFLPKSKHLLISWLQSAVILESKKIKSFTVYTFPSIYLPWSDGIRCHDLRFLNVGF